MSQTPQAASKVASKQPRDAHGHFVKEKDVKVKVSVTGQDLPVIPEFEKPLLQVSITNPFKKILYWLDQIRRRQTTTIVLKLSIPLIAMPVIILGVFSLGRVYGINFQKTQEVKSSPIVQASPLPDPIISRAGTLKIAVSQETKYLLALKNGELVVLDIPSSINLSKYQNKQVLVTGTYNRTANVIKVTDIAEVQLFNPIIIPESSQGANPAS